MATKKSGLDTQTFEELLKSVREGGAILRGQRKPSRRFVTKASEVRTIQERSSAPRRARISELG